MTHGELNVPSAYAVPHTPAQGGMSSALMVADVHVFRHEFITQFRYSHCATVHPADMHILEPIEDHSTLYEEEKGTVFLARDVMTRMQKLSMQARRPVPLPAQRYHHRPRYSMPASMSSAHLRS
ncbi:hypothetical protein L227DRAFT_578415 [Lentinus tigrinus ALCF2SS1-6]|uniref:Uncharacterized protein n=1 Tax=Lentinus tigrinus ALCF2SS1-6 TaxID=1328759 RepID=A0A5C2S0Y4_9APHY|nr:hypothetical protein L227DRAFT_578415 [Lentinus tigrinus ALCF2SS1-6]